MTIEAYAAQTAGGKLHLVGAAPSISAAIFPLILGRDQSEPVNLLNQRDDSLAESY